MSELEYQFFVGVDWGSETHIVCVLDRDRRGVAERSFPHSGLGLTALADELTALAPSEPGRIAVAIEVPRGAVVDTVLKRGIHVFSINPKQLDRFRDRHTVAGAKDDRRDAFVLADSLRTDRPAFRRVQPDHPRVVELRELSRVEDDLGQELRRLSNRLREQLHRFFPQALTLCPAADDPWVWALLERVPTPAHAQRLPAKTVAAVLKVYRIRRFTVDTIREALQTPAVHVAPGTVEAASAHIGILLPRLRLRHVQRTTVAGRIEALLEELGQEDVPGEHRDVTILRSLPGVGRVVAATVLAEAARPLAERDYQTLRAHGGIAPVTRQSGTRISVSMRYACNPRLRNAFYHWARTSVQSDPICRAHYDRLRRQGHGHARALRGVADRSLGVLLPARVGVLLAEGPRQFDPAGARLEIDLMLVPDRGEVPHEIGLDGDRQGRETVLVPFPGTHHDLVARDIEVLHAQAGALEQAEPCAIEEDRHEPRDAVDLSEHGADFLGRQDDRQVVRALGIDEVVEPGDLLLEDLSVEEEEGAEGLVLRRCRHLAIDGQRRQEARELPRSHLGGMAGFGASPGPVSRTASDGVWASGDRAGYETTLTSRAVPMPSPFRFALNYSRLAHGRQCRDGAPDPIQWALSPPWTRRQAGLPSPPGQVKSRARARG